MVARPAAIAREVCPALLVRKVARHSVAVFAARSPMSGCAQDPPRSGGLLHLPRPAARSRRSASNTGGGSASASRRAASVVRPTFAGPQPRKTGRPRRSAMISRRVRPFGASGQRPIRSWKSKNTGTTSRMYRQ